MDLYYFIITLWLIKSTLDKIVISLLIWFLRVSSKSKDKTILVNLSGRGDKDIDFVIENYPIPNAKF